jgi:ribonuclease E
VVTRTRRRAASRPAGPPVVTLPPVAQVSGVDSTTDGTAVAVIDGAEVGEDAHPVIEHVPVKKRGARKR